MNVVTKDLYPSKKETTSLEVMGFFLNNKSQLVETEKGLMMLVERLLEILVITIKYLQVE